MPDENDAEGHIARFKATPDADKPGPDDVVRGRPVRTDDAAPGPDESRLSDRTRKVGIAPIVWD